MMRPTLAAIGLLFFQISTLAAVPSVERDALEALYNSTNGAKWATSTNWMIGDPCMDGWYGVTCDESANIIEISLSGNNLVGLIPAKLGNLTNLRELSLYDNQLSGSIPAELGNLTNPWQLSLGNNQLSGSIPAELGNLGNVWYLSLRNNQLSGSIPAELGNLTNLKFLYLAGNRLSGSIPAELGNLTNLEELHLNTNKLSGPIPTTFARLRRLDPFYFGLRLHRNALYTADADLDAFLDSRAGSDWSSTQTIAPGMFHVSGTGAHSVRLAWEPIEYTTDDGGYRVWFGTTPGGPYSDGGITANKSSTSHTVPGLSLGQRYHFIVRTETNSHSANPNIVVSDASIEVSGDTLVAPPGFFIHPTSGLTTTETGGVDTFEVVLDTQPSADVTIVLTSSDLSEGTISDASLTFTTSNWHMTQTVTVTGVDDVEPDDHRPYTIITGAASSTDIDYDGIDPDDISVTNRDDEDIQTAALEALYNSTNGASWNTSTNWLIGDPCIDGWYGVTCDESLNVIEIKLSDNNLVGTIPAELGNLITLQILYLSDSKITYLWRNQLTGPIPVELGNLTNLQRLSLGGNQLSEPIPAELGNLANLQYLSLGDNQLSGSIPAELGNLANLQVLSLGDNQLSGSIPAELGNLANLVELFLSDNELSGPIPAILANLANLRKLDLFKNQLSGSIPAELGNLVNLWQLKLYKNQLSGPIPAELGNLTNLYYLYLNSNRLSGPIPTTFTRLSNLRSTSSPIGLNLHWNALYTTDADLDAFLIDKDRGWSSTQTVAPGMFHAFGTGADSVTLAWEPIEYTADDGGYRVLFGTSSGGPYSDGGITANKTSTSHTVPGLNPGQVYYFIVTTETNSHRENTNIVISDKSTEVFMRTAPTQPTGIKASDGTHDDRTQVSWNAVDEAKGYRVFRCAGTNSDTCGSAIGFTENTVFDDLKGIPGKKYWYRVKACVAGICSTFSDADEGFKRRKPLINRFVSFDGDSKDDVLLRHRVTGRWQINFMNWRLVRPNSGPTFIFPNLDWEMMGAGDVNGDGRGDVLLRNKIGDGWWINLMKGRVRIGGATLITKNPDWVIAGVDDFDGDGKDDVLLRHLVTGRWYINFMDSWVVRPDSGLTLPLFGDPMYTNLNWETMGTGDFNGDGRGDVLLRKKTTGVWWIFLMNGRVINSGHTSSKRDLDWVIAGIGDFDGDGKDDVLLRHLVTGRWYINFMNWRLVKPNSGLTPMFKDLDWEMMGTGDFNGDGRDDILLRNKNTGTWWIYLMKGRVVNSGATAITKDLDWEISPVTRELQATPWE